MRIIFCILLLLGHLGIASKLKVVTSIAPITNMVTNVGGNKIEIKGIVPEGINSHTFEPAPSSARVLAQADLIIMNGLQKLLNLGISGVVLQLKNLYLKKLMKQLLEYKSYY